jgi:aquaporin related protein
MTTTSPNNMSSSTMETVVPKRSNSLSLSKPMFGLLKPHPAEHWSAPNKHFIATAGEFVGTFLFLLTAYLGHAMSVSFAPESATGGGNTNQTVVFISLSYGFSLLIAAWTLYRISGGLFNPAITLGLVLTGNLTPTRGALFVPTQMLGAICAAAVVSCIIPVDIQIVESTLAPNMNVAQGLFLEMVCPLVFHPSASLTCNLPSQPQPPTNTPPASSSQPT